MGSIPLCASRNLRKHISITGPGGELATRGHVNMHGRPFAAKSIANVLK